MVTGGAGVPVRVQHRVGARWVTVAGIRTKANGTFRAIGLRDPGAYRALARRTKTASGDVCLKDVSPVVR